MRLKKPTQIRGLTNGLYFRIDAKIKYIVDGKNRIEGLFNR